MQPELYENGEKSLEITFNEIENAAQVIFNGVWMDSSGIDFAKKCWDILFSAGLTKYQNEVELCEVGIRLITLGEIYREFNGIAFDEFVEPDFTEWAEALQLSKFRVGQMIGMKNNFQDEKLIEIEFDEAVKVLADSERITVTKKLIEGFGSESELCYNLFLSTYVEDENQLIETFEEFVNDVSIDDSKVTVLSWITEGCYAYY
jgi:hypothetical protein